MVDLQELTHALEKKRAFLEHDAKNPNLIAEIADLHLQLHQFDQAKTVVELGLESNPKHPSLLFVKGSIAMSTNAPELAIDVYKELSFEVGTAPEVSYNLGYSYLLNGQPLLAQDTLKKLVDTNNPYLPAHLIYAKACHHLGQMMDAITHIDDYLFQYPNDSEALGMLAMIYLDLEEPPALEYAEKALAIDPNNADALLVKATLNLTNFKVDDSWQYFEKAHQINPASGRAGAGLGMIAMANQDFKKARALLDKAVQDMPNHIGTWHILAWCQIFQQDLAGAKESFENANLLDRNFGETYGGLAVIAVMQNELEEAKLLCKKALGLDAICFSARFAQSLLIANKGSTERAEKMIGQILASDLNGQGSLQSLLIKMQSTSSRFDT
jgi:tetratricopeptide (TPR) repeat protein